MPSDSWLGLKACILDADYVLAAQINQQMVAFVITDLKICEYCKLYILGWVPQRGEYTLFHLVKAF